MMVPVVVVLITMAKVTGAIKNGERTSFREHPFFVSIHMGWFSQSICGGTVISSKQVITACHCMDSTYTYFVCLSPRFRTESCYMVQEYVCPDDFDDQEELNPHDIAVLTLRTALPESVCQMKLPTQELMDQFDFVVSQRPLFYRPSYQSKEDSDLIIIGLGLTNLEPPVPSTDKFKLNKAVMYGLNGFNRYPSHWKDCQAMICATGGDESFQTSCKGDSGGPLLWSRNNSLFLVGIISYEVSSRSNRYRCPPANSLSLFTNVYTHQTFIQTHNLGPRLAQNCPIESGEWDVWLDHLKRYKYQEAAFNVMLGVISCMLILSGCACIICACSWRKTNNY